MLTQKLWDLPSIKEFHNKPKLSAQSQGGFILPFPSRGLRGTAFSARTRMLPQYSRPLPPASAKTVFSALSSRTYTIKSYSSQQNSCKDRLFFLNGKYATCDICTVQDSTAVLYQYRVHTSPDSCMPIQPRPNRKQPVLIVILRPGLNLRPPLPFPLSLFWFIIASNHK